MAILQIIVLGVVLIIIKSFIKSPKLFSILFSILFAIIFTIQLSSLIITGEIADYKFYEHLNFDDIWSIKDFFVTQGIIIFFSLILVTITIHYLSEKWVKKKINKKTTLVALILTVSFLTINGGIINNFYKTYRLKLSDTSGTFDEALYKLKIDKKTYTLPSDIKATKGKNIIVLSVESFEKGYLSNKLKHLTPNLRELAKKNSIYSMEQCPGASWTAGSMYTAITGVPAFFGIGGNDIFQNTSEIKLTTMSKVLKKAGYDIEYLLGNKEYSGINDMLVSLGFNVNSEKDFDTKYSRPPWGINDKDLFTEIKKSLLKKNKSKKPFALFASTISTHFPNGLLDRSMEKILPPQKSKLEFMASAVDFFIGDLMDFLKKEKMLSNTVFYIYPDHLLMGNKSRVIEDFDERKLFLLTNAKLNLEGKKLYQIDLPKVILQGADIKNNAKFLTDFIQQKDKISYLKENLINLTRLNKSSLVTINCIDGIYVELKNSTLLTIKNKDKKIVYKNEKFEPNVVHKIVFDKLMRVVSSNIIKNDSELITYNQNTTSLVLSASKGLLYTQLKRGDFFGIAKKGKNNIIFSKKDLNLLSELNQLSKTNIPKNTIEIKSYSWNAKKSSSIGMLGKSKKLTRGLSIVKIIDKSKYTVKTFDTYASLENTHKFVQYLKKLQNSNVFYLVIGHDSMGAYLKEFSEELEELGIEKLSSIKNRQAYVMINYKGEISEETNDLSITKQLLIKKYFNDKTKTKSIVTKKFKTDWFIAHAGGKIDKYTYTDSKDALDNSYKKGFRIFELDIIKTREGSFVAAHDWKNWKNQTKYKGDLPPTNKEFMEQKIRGRYQPLDMKTINKWFSIHKDAILVTDKINEPVKFAKKFIDKKRLRMELFTKEAIEKAVWNKITPILSQKVLKQIKGNEIAYLKKHKIKYIAFSRKSIAKNKKLLLDLKKNNIKVYAYHLNKEFDEYYVLENEIGIVYGMYADSWDFNLKKIK